jgi:hypothetical protein
MPRYQGDPRWLEARYEGTCHKPGCEQAIRKGDRVFYYPKTRTVLARPCGHAEEAARDFEAHRQDEDGY